MAAPAWIAVRELVFNGSLAESQRMSSGGCKPSAMLFSRASFNIDGDKSAPITRPYLLNQLLPKTVHSKIDNMKSVGPAGFAILSSHKSTSAR